MPVYMPISDSNAYLELKTCEKLDLSHRAWMYLPEMREARARFNPCLFKGCIYLCGEDSKNIEAFSTQTERFTSAGYNQDGGTACSLYVDKDQLVLHSYQYISKFATGRTGNLENSSRNQSRSAEDKGSNSQPVIDQSRKLFFISRRPSALVSVWKQANESKISTSF